MRIHVIAIGNRMPAWVDTAFAEYAKRMPAHYRLRLHEVPARKRTKGVDIERLLKDECARIQAATPKGCHVIALERTGRELNTAELAMALQSWLDQRQDVALWIGGPEGLAAACVATSHEQWSLSRLTLAHSLVRVLVAEQLYRAWSIIEGHPYHR